MVKTFRKLAALIAAVALVSSFAVCASAVTVKTTTSYMNGVNIAVKAVVSADDNELDGAEVTYYATHENAAETAIGKVVYMDQKTAVNGSATFEFKTNADYINSAVKVGYTGADAAENDTIPGYDYVEVTNGDGTVKACTPIKADLAGPYTVEYTPADGYYVSALRVKGVPGADAIIVTQEGNDLTFYLTGVDSVDGGIIIDATETQNASGQEAGGVISSGGVIADGDSDVDVEYGDGNANDYKAEAGNRKITVIGQVQNLTSGADFGVIVTTSDITPGDFATLPTEGCYAAKAKNEEGFFAVQLIDTADAASATFIVPGETYNTAVYYKTGDGYKIELGAPVDIPSAQ